MKDGITIPNVAAKAPGIPALLYPAKMPLLHYFSWATIKAAVFSIF